MNLRISTDGGNSFCVHEAFFFRTKKCIGGKSHWQAEVNLANTDLKHFLQQTGPFAALDYPPRHADHDAVALRGSPCRCTMSCHWFGLIWSLEDRARRSYGTHVGQAVSSSHEHCKVAYLSGHPAKYLSLEVLRCWKPWALSDDAASGSHTASAAARAILGWALGDAVQRNQLQKTICEPERLPHWIAQPLCDDAALCVMRAEAAKNRSDRWSCSQSSSIISPILRIPLSWKTVVFYLHIHIF